LTEKVLPLVGRQDVVDAVAAAVDRVRRGRFAVVEVSGDPGIGKSRVLAEAERLAREAGLAVHTSRATQFEREAPLAMFADALMQVWLDGQDVDRFRVYSLLRRHLEDAVGGAALILDDLHWADQASLELVESLVRHPPEAPVLVVVAFRGARPPIRVVDAVTRAGDAASRLHLGPLTADDVRVLLPGVSPERLGLLVRVSRGNPFYLSALTRLTDGNLAGLVRERADVDEFTRQILRTLIVDVAGLAEPVQRVAYAAAVVGDHAAIDLVADVADLDVPTVINALDQLCWAGLGHMDGAWFAFPHPLVRAAAHELAGPAWRAQAHARAARYLREHDGPLHLLAHHVEKSAQYGDDTAVATLVEAGRSVVCQAPGTAARWLGKALRVLSTNGAMREQRPMVMLQYGRALGLAGELDRAWQVLQELMCDGSPVRAEAAAFGLVIARLRGDLDTAAALVCAELPTVRHLPVVEGKLRVQLAALAALAEEAEGTMAQARSAVALLDGRRPALAAAATSLGAWGALYAGDLAAAQDFARDAARLVDTVSDVTLRPHVELLGPLAWVETRLGALALAGEHLERAHAVVEQAGHSSAAPYLLTVHAALQTRVGNLGAAVRLSEQAGLLADQMGSLEMRGMADAVRVAPVLWIEGPAAALTAADRLADRPRSGTWWRIGQLNLAIAHAFADDVSPALELLTDNDIPWPADPTTEVLRQATLAQALAVAGDLAAAWHAAGRAEEAAAGLDHERGLAWYATAFVAGRAGRHEHSAALAQEAAARFAATRAPVEEARAHHLAGIAHAHLGRQDISEHVLETARAGFLACGATWLASTVVVPRCSASTAGVGALTRRERQIAELVATGLTNQEIAARLFLSRRTVESHLSHIFPKLNVRTRSSLARQLASG
jgi:DNA-binding CsgD family transcriptional regulator